MSIQLYSAPPPPDCDILLYQMIEVSECLNDNVTTILIQCFTFSVFQKSAKDLPPYSPYPSLEKRPAPQIYQATANSTALKTLQHVNQCRDNIEHNINAITKQHSERYTLPDTYVHPKYIYIVT